MFERILVPLDGSHLAEQALAVAIQFARHAGSSILLLSCVEPPMEYGISLYSQPLLAESLSDERIHKSQHYLERIVQSPLCQGLAVTTKIVSGWASQEILEVAGNEHVDVIFMSSHGRTGLSRWLMGSVAQKVMNQADIPVLLLRGITEQFQHPAHAHPLCAIVPLDGSEETEKALLPMATLLSVLAAPEKGIMHIAHVLPRLSEHKKALEVEKQALSYLEEVIQRLHGHTSTLQNLDLQPALLYGDDVVKTLLHATEEGKDLPGHYGHKACDLMMMASHGRIGKGRSSIGVVTERVLTQISRPAFMIRCARQ